MMRSHTSRRSSPLRAWLFVALWVAVIWGHSFLSGPESSAESMGVVQLLRGVVSTLGLDAHPRIAQIMADEQLIHHLVRKGAHFSEYFVLGILAFRALLLSLSHPVLSVAAFAGLWVSVPSIDETIQRFVPERSGQMSDVMLDMSGFAAAFVLCLLIHLLRHLLVRRH